MATLKADSVGGCQNVIAMLDTIADSEGTENIGNHGYNCIFGSTVTKPILFDDYSKHPNRLVTANGFTSTAAGRYQLLNRYWVSYKKLLKLNDFGPVSQDRIALQQLREQGAIDLLKQNRFLDAVIAISNIWASFPGAGYGQHEHKIEFLTAAYKSHGGI